MATQNPIEQEGTYPLPEAQVDRFMLKVVIDYPKLEEEKLIIRQNINGERLNVKPILKADEIIEARKVVRQVYLDEKIEKTDLEFECNYPEEKMTAVLDGQKTYRIFENLIVNVTKYAMPHTRVFVDIFREENEIVVQMKNVSKDELTFNPQEITERFVRGDGSRNSEGSGLGLAIVRSFTELQGGHFHVETEADLFKAEIRWPWKNK